jgi:hypothetical protein
MGLHARDEVLDLTGHWDLFFKKRHAPQYPAGCVYEEPKAKAKNNVRRRHLLMVEDAAGVSRPQMIRFHSFRRLTCQSALISTSAFCCMILPTCTCSNETINYV